MTPAEKRHLAYVLLLAFGLRLFVTVLTPVIGTDGYFFVKNSQFYYSGQFLEALKASHQPLYPMLIALLNKAVGNFEVAGKLVSLILGTLTVLPLYFLARSIFSHRVAVFAAFVLAFNVTHIRLSADIMTESAYTFFFVSAVWLSWEMLRGETRVLPVLAGVFTALAYYTRPEGLGVALIAVPWLFLRGLWDAHVPSRPLRTAFLFTLVIVMLVLPYVLFIHKETGVWNITKKGSSREIMGYETAKTPEERKSIDKVEERKSDFEWLFECKQKGYYPLIGFYIVGKFIKVCFYPFIPFMLLGLFTVRRNSGRPGNVLRDIMNIRMALSSGRPSGEFFIISIFLLYFIVLFMLATTSYYVSGRYLLPLMALSAMWTGAGMERTVRYLSEINLRGFNVSAGTATVMILVLLSVLTLPKATKIKRRHEIMQKEAGHWLRDRDSKRPPVIMGLQKVAFYADCEFVPMPDGGYNRLVEVAKDYDIDYLLIYAEETSPEVLQLLDDNEDFMLVKRWVEKKKGRHLQAYWFVAGHNSAPK